MVVGVRKASTLRLSDAGSVAMVLCMHYMCIRVATYHLWLMDANWVAGHMIDRALMLQCIPNSLKLSAAAALNTNDANW